MDESYYNILDLKKSNNPDTNTIKKAYKKAALKWHPDRSSDNKQKYEKIFKTVGTAYGVLSDPQKKDEYDRFGLNKQRFNRVRNPPPFFFKNGMGGFQFHTNVRRIVTKNIDILCTLAELFNGCTKGYGVELQNTVRKIQVKIIPGWKSGTKVIYKFGDTTINFIIKEIPNRYFKRIRDNLIWRCILTKDEVTRGIYKNVPKLSETDSDIIINTKNENLFQNKRKIIENRGMPITNTDKRGHLVIDFVIL